MEGLIDISVGHVGRISPYGPYVVICRGPGACFVLQEGIKTIKAARKVEDEYRRRWKQIALSPDGVSAVRFVYGLLRQAKEELKA